MTKQTTIVATGSLTVKPVLRRMCRKVNFLPLGQWQSHRTQDNVASYMCAEQSYQSEYLSLNDRVTMFVCVEVLRPSQPNGVTSSAVSLPRRGSNPRPPGLQSDAHPTEPPTPAVLQCFALSNWSDRPEQTVKTLNRRHRMRRLIRVYTVCQPASVAQLDAPSDWRPGGRGFNPRRGRQHSSMEIDHEILSTVILSLPLIQEGQLSVSGERMCTILVNRLED